MRSWGYGEGLPKKWGVGWQKKGGGYFFLGGGMGKLDELRKKFSDTVALVQIPFSWQR